MPHLGAPTLNLNPRAARKAAALRARARRLTAELEARAHEAVADFIHSELIGVELRLLRVEGLA